jgi:hypothetical protein
MMQDQAIRALRSVCGVSVLLGALIAACAGNDTPARTDELEQLIADTYGRGNQTGAGASGGNGAGGSSSSGTGGSAGGSMVGMGGSGSSACNGFELLAASCSGSVCHSAPTSGALTNFVFDEATAAALEGQPAPGSNCTTDSAPVFDSGNPAASLVMKKISGSASCGQRMPPGGPFLEQADIDCIQTWIESL